jgi:multimeric flavodoxin WrbA
MKEKNVLIFNGSARKTGNTSLLIEKFVEGAAINTENIDVLETHSLELQFCTGCLRCNLVKRCSLRNDDWNSIVEKMDHADVIVFASPVYFHHVSASMKKVIDRFRSLVHVQITKDGLIHTPRKEWDKELVLMLTMGSSDDIDAKPVEELFEFIRKIMAPGKELHILKGTRLAVTNHIIKSKEELEELYTKMDIPVELAEKDAETNLSLLNRAKDLGNKLTV